MKKIQSVTTINVSETRKAKKSIYELNGKNYVVGNYSYETVEHKGKAYSEVIEINGVWWIGESKAVEQSTDQPIAGYTAPETPQNDEKVEEVVNVPEVTETAPEEATEVEEVVEQAEEVKEEEKKPVKEEYTQLQLEKLSPSQLADITKRLADPCDNIITVMSFEELSLYRQNNLDTIADAEQVIKDSKAKAVIEAQESLIKRAKDNIEQIDDLMSSLKDELSEDSDKYSSTLGELVEEGDELVFYGVSELATFVGEDKRLISKHNKLNKIEKPIGRVGIRPIWTHEQAVKIKEYYENKR